MIMEPSANPICGGVARLLFRAGGAVLLGCFKPLGEAGDSNEDELHEELESDWGLESTLVTARRLAGGVLASERREE